MGQYTTTSQFMYEQALFGLLNGRMMPWEQDMLSKRPLPDTIVDPYVSQEADPRESMKLTYTAMAVWIEEAKKVNYFSKHFVRLSRMINNGVTAMGRGLVTLHARGEALDDVPMSIRDLIGVASYHLRKSYLGVLQTAKSNPEVSERLLLNQLSWNNTLLRLYRTREKLSEKVRKPLPAGDPAMPAEAAQPVLPAADQGRKLPAAKALENLPELFAPTALGAQRAFRAMSSKNSDQGPVVSGQISDVSGEDPKNSDQGLAVSGQIPDVSGQEPKNSDQGPVVSGQIPDVSGQELEINDQVPEDSDQPSENLNQEPEAGTEEENDPAADNRTGADADEEREPADGPVDEVIRPDDDVGQEDPGQSVPPHPAYFRILYNASRRSQMEGGEEGTMIFTYEEIRELLSDPVFCAMEPEKVPIFRQILGET